MCIRVYGPGQASSCIRYFTRSVQKQKMGLQLVRVGAGTDYVQIFGAMCGFTQIPYCEGGFVSIQEYVSIRQRWIFGASYKVKIYMLKGLL